MVKTALEKRTSLKIAQNGLQTGKTWITSLRDETGTKQRSRDKIIEICTKFYSNLYSDPFKVQNLTTAYHCPDSIPVITDQEVHKALKNLKYDRSPGEDGVTTESLKVGEPMLLHHLSNLFNSILLTGKVPQNLCHSNIILLHKKGDKSDLGNYRPISLVSHVYKTFIKVIQNRIDGKLDRHQPPELAGFRPSSSTTDHLQALNQVIEKYTEFHKPLYIASRHTAVMGYGRKKTTN
ncbi:reverse transcriptase (RNA-dependent DNA polymerase) domain-containing protein [Phthorimaea operculella]|nr:reverse transcriptase (RNA-dependent DNA polymerase) domain-containing protein [Phthorimaea operculella]